MSSLKSAYKSLSNLFQQLDLFGVPVQLQIRKKPMFHSHFGATVSLLLIGFIAYSFISMVVDMFERKNPVVLNNMEFVENPTLVELPFKQYFFALTVADQFGVPIFQQNDHLLYVITVEACTRTNNGTQLTAECHSFQLKQCNVNMIDVQLQEEMKVSLLFIANSYCIDPEDWKNSSTFKLQGTPQSPIFSSVTLRISKCDYITMSNQCAPQEEIDTRLFNSYVGILMPDRLLNQQQQGNPYKIVNKLITTKISSVQSKTMHVTLMKSYTETTENFFYYFGNTLISSALQFSKQIEYTETKVTASIIDIVLLLEDREITFIRQYDNILNILGSIGGLMELLIFLASLFIKPLNTLSSELYLANEIFQFEQNAKPDLNNLQQVYPEKLLGMSTRDDDSKFVKSRQYNFMQRMFKLKHQTLDINIFQYAFQCGNRKQRIKEAINQIYIKLDTKYLLNKINELEKLKQLLLSPNQLKLFNYIPKPKLRLSEQAVTQSVHSKSSNFFHHQELTLEEVIQGTYAAYKCLCNEKFDINNKLINMLDRDLKEYFENSVRAANQALELEQLEIINQSRLQLSQSQLIQEIEQIIQI